MKHTIAYLKHQLDKRTGTPRPNTIYRLGKLNHPEATRILLDLLNTSQITHESIQYILAALRYTDDPTARNTVLHYFLNGFETSTVVINSLGILREHRAVPMLVDILSGKRPVNLDYHSAMSLKFRVTIALGNIGDPFATEALADALSQTKLVLRFALSDVQLQVPLCEYAYQALLNIGTENARQIADNWLVKYETLLQEEAHTLMQQVQIDQYFVNLQDSLIRIKHYALDVFKAMSKAQLIQYPNITYNVLKEFAKQTNRITPDAQLKIQDFIIVALHERYKHLSLEQGFMLLDYYDDARAIPFAIKIFKNPDFHPDLHGDPLALLTRKRVTDVVPIIEHKIKREGISERYLTSLGAIGGDHAESIVTRYLDSEHGQIRMTALYALADLARYSESALERMSQMIDNEDYSLSQQAIIRMDKVGKRAVDILLNLLYSYDKWSSSRALSTLARIGDTSIIPHLIYLLSDSDYQYLQRDIITTLEKLETEDAYEIVNLWRNQSEN